MNIPKRITNRDVDEMIEGIQPNYILREGLCGVNLSQCDMSELDFEHFKLLCFDENTIFSENQQKKFKPSELLESAKAPMKEIQNLHNNGVDGRGIKVAIIDTNIDKEAARRKYGSHFQYLNSDFDGEVEPHGATVLDSFIQTAPGVEVQYYPFDKTPRANKEQQFIECIKQISTSGVKVISLSNSLGNIIKNEEKHKEIRAFLEQNEITLIDSDLFYRDFTYCFRDINSDGSEEFKECLCEPEDLQHKNLWNEIYTRYHNLLLQYNVETVEKLKEKLEQAGEIRDLQALIEFEPILNYSEFSVGEGAPLHFLKQRDKQRERDKREQSIEIPCGGRTLAGKYWGTSSASYTIPVIAGIFAICKQVYPQIQYEDYTKLCKETSQIINGCNLIQPQMLMERVISLREQSNQITEMGTGRYSISEQQIGKVTADTSTMKKSDAQRKVTRDEQELEQLEQCITKEN